MPGPERLTATQQILDTRALEVASAALGRVEAIEVREQRADVHRAELRSDIHRGFDQAADQIDQLGKTVHARISVGKSAGRCLVYGAAGTVILLLLSAVVFLILELMGW